MMKQAITDNLSYAKKSIVQGKIYQIEREEKDPAIKRLIDTLSH
jgi:hypothetical protein